MALYIALKLSATGALWFFSLLVALIYWQPWHWLVCAALAFSWFGDAMLAKFRPVARFARDSFIAGMAAFAAAQAFYILAASNSISNIEKLHTRLPGFEAGREILPNVLPVYLLFGAFVWALTVARGDKPFALKAMAFLYCELVCAMAAYALSASFTGYAFVWQLAAGGFLFIISDSAIAARVFRDRFVSERFYEALVWGTYFPAQLFLMLGFARLH